MFFPTSPDKCYIYGCKKLYVWSFKIRAFEFICNTEIPFYIKSTAIINQGKEMIYVANTI